MTIPDPAAASRQVAAVLGDELPAFQKVRKTLRARMRVNRIRDFYIEGDQAFKNMGIAVPPHLEQFATVIGWPAKAIQVVSSRLSLEGFLLPGESQEDSLMAEVMDANDLYSEAPQFHESSMQHGCAFVSVTQGNPLLGEPEALVRAYSAKEASGLYSGRLRRLTHALTVDDYSPQGSAVEMNWWTAESRVRIWRDAVGDPWKAERLPHFFRRCPVVMMAYQQSISKKYGASRITRAIMTLTDQAARTSLRSEVAAEFFSAPQRWLMGADESAFEDEDGNKLSGWESLIGSLLVISRPFKNEDGDELSEVNPQAGQFPQMSMQPHSEQMRSIAMQFAGEASIPVAYLGVIQDNPSSADAIRQLEQDLITVVDRATVNYTSAWRQIAQLCAQAVTNSREPVDAYRRIKPMWRDPSTPTQAATTQAVAALVQAGVLPADSEVTYKMLRLDEPTRAILRAEAAQRRAQATLEALAGSSVSPETEALNSRRS